MVITFAEDGEPAKAVAIQASRIKNLSIVFGFVFRYLVLQTGCEFYFMLLIN